MRIIIIALLTCSLTGSCVQYVRPGPMTENETEEGLDYTYMLSGIQTGREDLVEAFSEITGISLDTNFTGDWTSSDDDGIEYSLSARRSRVIIDYDGGKAEVVNLAKQKAQEFREAFAQSSTDK